jgi:SSS family transporter
MSLSLADRPLVAATVLVYLIVVLGIGVWSWRRTRSARDFFIAGQRVGLWVIGLATMSAAFSGFVFLGGPGLTYRIGVASLMIVLPLGLTGGLLCWTVGRRLRLLAGRREIFTVPDAIACRFGGRVAPGLAALAVLCGSVAYLGLQMQALGILLRAVFGLSSLGTAVVLGAAILLVYSVLGGMIAGVYTDVVQGGLMLVAALGLFGQALHVCGGFGAMTQAIAGAEPFGRAFLEPLGRVPVFTVFGLFFVFGIGVLGQPQMLHKFYMLDDPRKLRFLPLVLGGSQALCVLIWIGVGLAVPALVASGRLAPLTRPDDAAPLFLLHFTPDILAGVAIAGILAAIMSTADSFLNIGSAALVRDLPRALGRGVRDELVWGRWAVLLLSAAAALVAALYGDLIALLGTFAFGTFGAALAPALAVGLNWRRVSAAAAAASIGTGMTLTLILEFLARQSSFPGLPRPPLATGVPPAAFSLVASFVVLLVVSWWSAPTARTALDEELRAVMED